MWRRGQGVDTQRVSHLHSALTPGPSDKRPLLPRGRSAPGSPEDPPRPASGWTLPPDGRPHRALHCPPSVCGAAGLRKPDGAARGAESASQRPPGLRPGVARSQLAAACPVKGGGCTEPPPEGSRRGVCSCPPPAMPVMTRLTCRDPISRSSPQACPLSCQRSPGTVVVMSRGGVTGQLNVGLCRETS